MILNITKILLLFLLLACSLEESESQPLLVPIREIPLSITEPSGLAFGANYGSYWVVSDGQFGKIYQLTLNGVIVRELQYVAEDMEGISYDHNQNTLWVVEERSREVLKFDLNGNLLQREQLAIEDNSDSGLEGITFINNREVWVSNEKSPRILLKIDENFDIENQLDLTKAKDYSGLSYNPVDSTLFIISDESKLLIKWDMTKGAVTKYSLPIAKAEGVSVNPVDQTIHIVSDETAIIYVFNIPQ
jgi:uncharacterized protein YjiK